MITRTNSIKITLLAALATLLTFTSCDPGYRMVNCQSYVVCYSNLASLWLYVDSADSRCIIVNNGTDAKSWTECSMHSTGPEQERYEQLCQKHFDLNYNQKRLIGDNLDFDSVNYIDCDFSEITVTADKNFDASHPAGTNLSDIIRFMSWSPYKYILSGYSQYYHYYTTDVSEAFDRMMRIYIGDKYFSHSTDATCYPVDKLVKDLTSDDLILLGHDSAGLIGMLYFESAPAESGEYTITVSLTTDEDRVISESIAMQF